MTRAFPTPDNTLFIVFTKGIFRLLPCEGVGVTRVFPICTNGGVSPPSEDKASLRVGLATDALLAFSQTLVWARRVLRIIVVRSSSFDPRIDGDPERRKSISIFTKNM